ncbi:MAG TPA: bifunctional 4-hydroxy-2-oxoglutarate aldolase/2-dehydro-3-deoxy-phosphogluconate aldolase [Gaiellaceae bacterium]|nr:bifunctional 4-hydroxy-2-oxoglutarate aldolase/2-dehydro-3-deoxy-phosphogluconate aldolase [Gaiellaceae bacterium]
MAEATSAVDRIREERIVAVLRRTRDVDAVVDALLRGGIRVVEITLDSPDALATIERLRRKPDVAVLAGTVRTAAQADAAVEAGAQACVAPALVPAMIARCRALGVPAIPGTLTPSEVEAARGLGAELVKLFPAGLLGPGYVRDVLAPLSDVPLLATGGVDLTNAREFLDAGAVAVGVGSALTGSDDVAAAARRLVDAVRA